MKRFSVAWIVLLLPSMIFLGFVEAYPGNSMVLPIPSQNWLDMELLKAIRKQNLPKIRRMIDEGADVNNWAVLHAKGAPLRFAINTGNVAIARILLRAGANANERNLNGDTPLIYAAEVQRVDMVRLLIDWPGTDIDAANQLGKSALIKSIRSDAHETTFALIEAGSDVNKKAMLGITPLMLAANVGNLEVVKKLLEYGADKSAVADNGLRAVDLVGVSDTVREAINSFEGHVVVKR